MKLFARQQGVTAQLQQGDLCVQNVADYAKKVPVYLPKDFEGNDYDDLPEGHKVYKKPSVDAKPSQFEVRLYGDEGPLKGGKRHTLVINLRLFDILEKFE